MDLGAAPSANPDGYLFAAAVHRGDEAIANKSYWNVVLGVDRASFASLGTCRVSGLATASDGALVNSTTPDASAYPVIEWDLPLSEDAGRLCTRHAVDDGTGVATRYASGAAPEQFTYGYQRSAGVSSSCVPATEVCANDVDDDCDGLTDEPVWADDFDGTSLRSEWTTQVIGGQPTSGVNGGQMTTTDAAYAATPSSGAAQSWIYDLNQDRGNQLVYPQAIGTGDFDVQIDQSWISDNGSLQYAGIALTHAAGLIELFDGYTDGGSASVGSAQVLIRGDAGWADTLSAVGTGQFRLTRQAGQLVVTVDGIEQLSAANSADIAAISIVSLAHYSGASTFPFHTHILDYVGVCY